MSVQRPQLQDKLKHRPESFVHTRKLQL